MSRRRRDRKQTQRSLRSADRTNSQPIQHSSKLTRAEKWSIGLSLIAIALSLAAVGVGIWQYNDRKQFDQLERKSRLDARVGAVTGGITRFTANEVSHRILFRQRYRCILTNNGYAPTSLVDWRVVELAEPSPNGISTGQAGGWYVGMDPRLVDAEGKEIDLPIRFEPAESKVLFIEVDMVVPEVAWRATRGKIPLDQAIAWEKADSIFNAADYPLFGQVQRVPIANTGTPPLHTYVDGPHYQEFVAYFVKGNGKQARVQFSIMGNDAFLQQADEEADSRY